MIHCMSNQRQMKFSTRMLMGLTPIALAIGVTEAWRLAGGLVTIIGVQIILMGLAAWALVRRIREERNK